MEQLRPSSETENINEPGWQAMLRGYFNNLSPYKSPVRRSPPFTNEQRGGVTVPALSSSPTPRPPVGLGGQSIQGPLPPGDSSYSGPLVDRRGGGSVDLRCSTERAVGAVTAVTFRDLKSQMFSSRRGGGREGP